MRSKNNILQLLFRMLALPIMLFLSGIATIDAQSTDVKPIKEFSHYRSGLLFYQPVILSDLSYPTGHDAHFLMVRKIDHLHGFFCQMEYKLERKSKLAPRFRLGSLNYTNWMEGKGRFESRYWK